MIRFGKLTFKYKNRIIFNNLDLTIKDKSITTIIGPNGCGKSTLMKVLLGLLPYDGSVTVDGDEVKDNCDAVRRKIGFVADRPQIVNEIVFDEIAGTLKNAKDDENIKQVHDIAKLLKIEDVLDSNINDLNTNQKQLVCLASALVHNPKILILDEALAILDTNTKDDVINLLKSYKEMSIIIISHDIEDTLCSDRVVVLNNGEVVLQGSKEDIYSEEKMLNDLGYKLPFMVELSNRLIFYGLIDHVIYDMKEMVDALWQ